MGTGHHQLPCALLLFLFFLVTTTVFCGWQTTLTRRSPL